MRQLLGGEKYFNKNGELAIGDPNFALNKYLGAVDRSAVKSIERGYKIHMKHMNIIRNNIGGPNQTDSRLTPLEGFAASMWLKTSHGKHAYEVAKNNIRTALKLAFPKMSDAALSVFAEKLVDNKEYRNALFKGAKDAFNQKVKEGKLKQSEADKLFDAFKKNIEMALHAFNFKMIGGTASLKSWVANRDDIKVINEHNKQMAKENNFKGRKGYIFMPSKDGKDWVPVNANAPKILDYDVIADLVADDTKAGWRVDKIDIKEGTIVPAGDIGSPVRGNESVYQDVMQKKDTIFTQFQPVSYIPVTVKLTKPADAKSEAETKYKNLLVMIPSDQYYVEPVRGVQAKKATRSLH